MSKVSFVNKNNLKVARENMGFTTLYASKRIYSKTKKDIVNLWEKGEGLPTWKQLEKIAHLYNISELILASDKNIEKNKEIPDFRIGLYNEREINGVKKLINLVLKRQKWLEDILISEGKEKNKLLGSCKKYNDPKELANYIRKALEINIEEIKKKSGGNVRKKVLKYLIEKAEDKGIFVGKTISFHKISVQEMRGVFISNDYCPFIILNRQDSDSAQIFSLAHELAHFFRKSDSISNIDFRNSDNKLNKEEVLCNKVAANLLLPEEEFKKDFYSKKEIYNLADEFKVSRLFVFYRLKELKKIELENIKKIEEEIIEETQRDIENIKNNRKKKKGGDYYNSMIDSNGRLFNRIVADCYFTQRITYIEATNLFKFPAEVYD